MQIEVDEKSRDALTIATGFGLFTHKRLPEGIASSPMECQEILESVSRGIDNTEIYIDNVHCTGKTDEEHTEILQEIFCRLEEVGLRVNPEKCDFFKKELEILGFLINRAGLKPAPSKVKVIHEARLPKNHKELEAFLGLVIFYKRSLQDCAEFMKPLYDLGKQAEWVWTKECDAACDWIKIKEDWKRVKESFGSRVGAVRPESTIGIGVQPEQHKFIRDLVT